MPSQTSVSDGVDALMKWQKTSTVSFYDKELTRESQPQ